TAAKIRLKSVFLFMRFFNICAVARGVSPLRDRTAQPQKYALKAYFCLCAFLIFARSRGA
ncbi:hypothetical protein KKC04_02535, partial [Patescibacteria group bacterium]|nr:hypothetical protein [Patescibacteria group bacterium]